MSTFGTLLEALAENGVTLENFDRTGRCRSKLDGPGLLRAIRAQRAAFAGWTSATIAGRKLVGLLFKSDETLDFLVATFAAMAEGYTVVPLYPNWNAEQQRFYLQSYGIRTLIVGEGFRSRAEQWRDSLERLVPVSLNGQEGNPTDRGDLKGDELFPSGLPKDHPCAWIFTSGTSSDVAKCTEITFGNLEAAIENIQKLDFLRDGMTVHSPLSASHIFAFVVILGFLALKPRRCIFSDVQFLARLSQERTGKVDAIILVPIVLNRMRRGFYEKLASPLDPRTAPPELKRLARLPRSLRLGLKRLVRRAEDAVIRMEDGRRRAWLGLPGVLLARALFGKIFQNRLGSPDFVVVGGAKPDLHAMALLEVMGIRCLQGWGMTETTGPLAVCNLKDRYRGAFGTCGDLFSGTQATIEEGELVVEGPQIARGYVEPGGKLHDFGGRKRTGDTAEFDTKGRLKVLGKASDRITTENGLNYNPVPMEEELRAADLNAENLLEEVVVIGEAKPRLGGVFFLREGLQPAGEIQSYLASLVRDFNARRPVDEQIGPWSVSPQSLKESGALGPSGKLVRRRVEERFARIYGELVAVD